MRETLPVFVVLLALLLIAAVVATGVVLWSPDQTIGVVLIYRIDPPPGSDPALVDMGKLIAAINGRINPGWSAGAQVRQLDGGRIEIGVFGSEPGKVQRIERLVETTGQLEFRLLAKDELIEQAKQQGGDVLRNQGGDVLTWWVPVYPGQEAGLRGLRTVEDGTQEVLVVKDVFDLTEADLQHAVLKDDIRGQRAIELVLDQEGAQRLGKLTGIVGPNAGFAFVQPGTSSKLGIILDGRLRGVYDVEMTYTYERVQITGPFTREEADDLIAVLNAGALPVAVKQVAKREGGAGP